jgi:hypothetical protein
MLSRIRKQAQSRTRELARHRVDVLIATVLALAALIAPAAGSAASPAAPTVTAVLLATSAASPSVAAVATRANVSSAPASASNSAPSKSYLLNVVESASRETLFSQKFARSSGDETSIFKLKTGDVLKGATVTVRQRPVTVDGKPGFTFVELTLLDSKENILAYGTGTFPAGAFTLGAGFPSPKNPQDRLILTLDTTSMSKLKATSPSAAKIPETKSHR